MQQQTILQQRGHVYKEEVIDMCVNYGFDIESDVKLFESYSVYMGPKYEKSALTWFWMKYQTREYVSKIRKNNNAEGVHEHQGLKKLH